MEPFEPPQTEDPGARALSPVSRLSLTALALSVALLLVCDIASWVLQADLIGVIAVLWRLHMLLLGAWFAFVAAGSAVRRSGEARDYAIAAALWSGVSTGSWVPLLLLHAD